MYVRWVTEGAFTDRAGIHWIRRATGELEELPESPLEYSARVGSRGPHELVRSEPADE